MRMRTPCAVLASALGLLLVAKGATSAQAGPAAQAAPVTQVGALRGDAARASSTTGAGSAGPASGWVTLSLAARSRPPRAPREHRGSTP